NDADGTANGVIQVDKVKLGTYTVTETVAPAGYALDATPSRTVTVSAGNTITDLGTASSNDTSDFHDFLGALRWEKRDGSNSNVLLAGATFTISPNPLVGGSGDLTVTDGGANDADGVANGVI